MMFLRVSEPELHAVPNSMLVRVASAFVGLVFDCSLWLDLVGLLINYLGNCPKPHLTDFCSPLGSLSLSVSLSKRNPRGWAPGTASCRSRVMVQALGEGFKMWEYCPNWRGKCCRCSTSKTTQNLMIYSFQIISTQNVIFTFRNISSQWQKKYHLPVTIIYKTQIYQTYY